MKRTSILFSALALLACCLLASANVEGGREVRASFAEGEHSCATSISLLDDPFVFFNSKAKQLYICSNGLLLFEEPSKEFDPTNPQTPYQPRSRHPRVVAPYWTSRLRQVDITATLQNYPSVEAVEMVEQAFPGTVITPTRSLNITWAYSDMSVSAIFIMDGETMISYGVFFYGGQYLPATPSSLDWLMGEIFSTPATTEKPVIGFSADDIKLSASFVAEGKEWTNMGVHGRVVFGFSNRDNVPRYTPERLARSVSLSKKQLENVQLRLVSFSAEPENGVWTKDSNFMVDYSFVNDGETATELEWGDQLYLSTTPDLSGVIGSGWSVDQIFMGTDFVAGEPVSSSIMGTLDLDAPGTYYLILQLAAYGVAPDVDNLNDTIAIFEFDVTGEEQSPDLQITSIDLNPNPVPLDQGFVVEYSVTNLGDSVTDTNAWYDDVYIFQASEDRELGTNYITWADASNIISSPLEPGESYTHSHTINMNDRGLLPGEYYLVIFTNHIIEGEEPYVTTEANRENNVAEIHFWPEPSASSSPSYAPEPSASSSPSWQPEPSPSSSPLSSWQPEPSASSSPSWQPEPSPSSSPLPSWQPEPSPSASPAASHTPTPTPTQTPTPTRTPTPTVIPTPGAKGRTVINFNFRDLIPAGYYDCRSCSRK